MPYDEEEYEDHEEEVITDEVDETQEDTLDWDDLHARYDAPGANLEAIYAEIPPEKIAEAQARGIFAPVAAVGDDPRIIQPDDPEYGRTIQNATYNDRPSGEGRSLWCERIEYRFPRGDPAIANWPRTTGLSVRPQSKAVAPNWPRR